MTSEEIDAEIVDTAARLFARHGYRQTSLQVIADGVGYSKTGLLHRFSSKEGLWEVVVADFRAQIASVTDATVSLPLGEARDRAVVEAVIDVAARRPGLVRLMFSLLTLPEDDPDAALLREAPRGLLAAFGAGPGADLDLDLDDAVVADPERAVPLVGALGVLAVSTLLLEKHQQARPLVVQAAMRALGHPS
ncbi:MAG: TetR/AcrR family transcriptional regulator [Actinomycetota bacterium]|nr:TetR/AcrR family transcriptional regulator [Actinomycetota bacterium]